MPIPRVSAYAMPSESELVTRAVTWSPDPRRAALLIHDMQRFFVNFLPADEPPTADLLANIGRIRQAADALSIPVIYTAQPGRMSRHERGLLYDVWGPGMRSDPRDRDIVGDLRPRAGELVLTKYRYSAFHRTGLADSLAAARRDQLVICGVYAHVGCLLTACDAFAYDIQPFLVADAVADFSRPEHLMALSYAARRCAVVVTTDGLLAAFRAGAGRQSG